MKFLIAAIIAVMSLTSYAADTKQAAKPNQSAAKKCDPLKQKDCKKESPSANKPIPKKKAEK